MDGDLVDESDGLVVSLENVERAAAVIDPVFRDTPQFVAPALSAALGTRVVLKVETVNPVRSFKGRGGDYLAHLAGSGQTLACASAGNLGQGIAYAARTHHLRCIVFAAADARPLKVAQMRALGADVRLVDGDFDAAKVAASVESARHGWRLVEDGREPALAEGAATLAVELTRTHGTAADYVFVPVGNGSLVCGVAAWFKAVTPATRIVAVGVTASASMERAWRTGRLDVGGPISTMAEGLAARVPVQEAVATMRRLVDEYVLVDESSLLVAMRMLLLDCGVVAEPSGAAALAAAMAMRDTLKGASVAVPIGGANVEFELLARAVAHG